MDTPYPGARVTRSLGYVRMTRRPDTKDIPISVRTARRTNPSGGEGVTGKVPPRVLSKDKPDVEVDRPPPDPPSPPRPGDGNGNGSLVDVSESVSRSLSSGTVTGW